jgi:hypothetical protein
MPDGEFNGRFCDSFGCGQSSAGRVGGGSGICIVGLTRGERWYSACLLAAGFCDEFHDCVGFRLLAIGGVGRTDGDGDLFQSSMRDGREGCEGREGRSGGCNSQFLGILCAES